MMKQLLGTKCRLLIVIMLLLVSGLYAAVPIHEASLSIRGINPADARQRVLSTAQSFLGVPYRWGGTDRRGIDCSGLIYTVFREALRYNTPRTSLAMYNWAYRIPRAQLQPGDLLFFVTAGSRVSHVGIYTGGGRFIHSASAGPNTGVIISGLDESFWQRTFRSAGRVLPPDNRQIAAANPNTSPDNPSGNSAAGAGHTFLPGGVPNEAIASARAPRNWGDSGFFAGAGAAWSWLGGAEGAPQAFRGFSGMLSAGYKWNETRISIELRPQWDNSLGVFRLPFTLALGTDRFQVFAGPAFTFGQPALEMSNGLRQYVGGWQWEVGASAAFAPIRIGPGGLSFFGELAWQSHQRSEGLDFRFRPDALANIRLSTGVRYLWLL